MESCADLLNLQWPRSKTARLHSLGKSCDTLPCSLVLVTSLSVDGHPGRVIGHSMLSQVIAMEDACFVESVLVDPQLRGKGLGRRLMGASEDYAALLGYRTVYLSTHDKQEFYGHLGYEFCDPISKLDSCTKLLPAGLLKQLGMSSSAKQHQLPSPKERKSVKKTQEETDLENKNYSAVSLPVKELSTPPSVVNILSPPANVAPPANIPPPPPTNIPPPPPPPPPPTNIPPLPPPPPPTNIPPPPPPPPTTNLQPPQALPRSSKTNLEIVNMDSNQISWMKKELDKK